MNDPRNTICWDCANTRADKCTFFDPKKRTPVDGWTAFESIRNGEHWSYLVLDCPNFTPGEGWRATDDSVKYDDASQRWIVTVYYQKKHLVVGLYNTLREALLAKANAINRMHHGLPPVDYGEDYE